MNLCVFLASSKHIDPAFNDVAVDLGRRIAQRGDTLIFGGTDVGSMRALAQSVQQHGGKVVGICPRFMHQRGIACEQADELVVVDDMRQRKAVMEERADAFIALPGGFGTLEELIEIITLKHLQQHAKPIVIINAQGFYDPLVELINHMHAHRFASDKYRGYFEVASDPQAALAYLDGYQAPEHVDKWR